MSIIFPLRNYHKVCLLRIYATASGKRRILPKPVSLRSASRRFLPTPAAISSSDYKAALKEGWQLEGSQARELKPSELPLAAERVISHEEIALHAYYTASSSTAAVAFVCSATSGKLSGSPLNRLNWLPFKSALTPSFFFRGFPLNETVCSASRLSNCPVSPRAGS